MENILVWILIFAGAVLGLLATFLIASERELQAQQNENKDRSEPLPEATTVVEASASGGSWHAQAKDDALQTNDALTRPNDTHPTSPSAAFIEAKESELENLRREVSGRTQLCSQLENDNLRLREEVLDLERQLGSAMRDSECLNRAQERLSAILAQHNALASCALETQQALVALAGLLIPQSAVQSAPQAPPRSAAHNEFPDERNAASHEPGRSQPDGIRAQSAAPIYGSNELPLIDPFASDGEPTKRLGKALTIILFVVALGAIATQAWRLSPESDGQSGEFALESAQNITQASAANRPATIPDVIVQGPPDQARLHAQSTQSPSSSMKDAPTARPQAAAAQQPVLAQKVSPALPQARKENQPRTEASPPKPNPARYETVRPAQVFSEPSDSAESITEIEPGMEVSVVNAQNGWLEIRSKHGRPPGFIKYETVVRVSEH